MKNRCSKEKELFDILIQANDNIEKHINNCKECNNTQILYKVNLVRK